MKEEWRDIKDYEGLYQVSNLSRVKSLSRTVSLRGLHTRLVKEKVLSPGLEKTGYNTVSLWKDNKGKTHKISRLVAIAFIDNPNNYPVVNHLDGNKLNDTVSNLEWCSYSDNTKHAVKTGLVHAASGENAAMSKLSELQVKEIRAITNKSNRKIALDYGVSHHVINCIKSGKTWKHI